MSKVIRQKLRNSHKEYYEYLEKLNKDLVDGKITVDVWFQRFNDRRINEFINSGVLGRAFWDGDETSSIDDIVRAETYKESTDDLFSAGFYEDLLNKNPDYFDLENEIFDLDALNRRSSYYVLSLRGYANAVLKDNCPDDCDIYWETRAKESCIDCLRLKADSPYTKETLGPTPGDMTLTCNTGCQCYLKFVLSDGKSKIGFKWGY